IRKLAGNAGPVHALTFSPDGKLLAFATGSTVRLVQVGDGKEIASLAGPDGASALTFSPDGKILYAGGKTPEAVAWHGADGKESLRLKTGQEGAIVAFAEGGTVGLLAHHVRDFGRADRVQVWDLGTNAAQRDLEFGDGEILCESAAFSRNGRIVASSQI